LSPGACSYTALSITAQPNPLPTATDSMRKNLKNIGLIAAGLATGVFATLQLSASAQQPASSAVAPLPLDQLRLFAEVFGQIKHEYVEPVDDKKLLTAAIKGMVSSLDPHSSYLDKTDYEELQEQTKGRFAGLGIEISSEDGLIKVISPIEDTPAFRAGIRPGDLITRINDKPVRGMTLDQAVKQMRGDPGTKVTLTIFRKTDDRTFPLTVTRAIIRVQSVKMKILAPGYAYIRITSFQERTTPDLAEKLQEIARQQYKDLRHRSAKYFADANLFGPLFGYVGGQPEQPKAGD